MCELKLRLTAFFTSCCAYLPVFEPWHARLHFIRGNIDHLDPASQVSSLYSVIYCRMLTLISQVAVAAFCAMGARASPHSVR